MRFMIFCSATCRHWKVGWG